MKDRMLFRNELPYRARVEFCALESLVEALQKLKAESDVLCVKACTVSERAEWGLISSLARDAIEEAVAAIDATMGDTDTYDAVETHVRFHRMYYLAGGAGALSRLDYRNQGLLGYSTIGDCTFYLYERLQKLTEGHEQNHRSKRFCHKGIFGSWVYGVWFPNGSAPPAR